MRSYWTMGTVLRRRLCCRWRTTATLLSRAQVAEALAKFPNARSIGALRKLLSDREELTRANAAEALGKLRASAAARHLLATLRSDRSPLVRGYAAEALGKLRRPALVPALATLLEHERSGLVRLYIVFALYSLGERRRWTDVLGFLNDADYWARSTAVALLEDLLSPSRRKVIRAALAARLKIEPTVAVAERIREALRAR